MELDFNRILFVNSYVCNMNCPYCMHYEHKKNKKIKPGMAFGLEASKKLFDTFIENSPYKKIQITFSGGEPLVFYKQYIVPMVLYMREKEKQFDKKVIVDMFTNGTLLTKDKFDFFKDNEVYIGISYDGHCGQRFRDEKTQKKVEDAILLGVKEIPKLLSVASTFSRDTLPYLYDSYQTMIDMGVKRWSFAVDTLTTNRDNKYTLEDVRTFEEQVQKVWNDLEKYDVKVSTFDKIKDFAAYSEDNKAVIARPDGEICIGTSVPILIPEKLFSYFSIGYWEIDQEKLNDYYRALGDFHIHVMGKNHPSFCENCYVKTSCQDVKITPAESIVRNEADPMHCLEYLIVSNIMKGTPLE
jgi:sulfatase maturation enzyme AslB (radical SAM superfamily)